jgi:phosphoenolpyruvate carboxylase
MGQWIGGDRDGNPFVSAQTLEYALRRQAEVALRHYLTEVHYLGSELSVSAMLADCSADMQALAESSPDRNVPTAWMNRTAGHSPVCTPAWRPPCRNSPGTEAARHAVAPQNPYRLRPGIRGRTAHHRRHSLRANHGTALISQRLQPLLRAVDVFGFHLATVDLRQSSDKHEEVRGRTAGHSPHQSRVQPRWTRPPRRSC